MSKVNLFDHGISSQISIIKPFMSRVRDRAKDGFTTEEFKSFFLGQLTTCLAMISEHENLPVWVKDVKSYRMKSEIVIFTSLLSCLEFNEEPDMAQHEAVNKIYDLVRDLGQDRGWNLGILHVQFLRVMGAVLNSHLHNIIQPRTLEPIDYN